MNSFFSLLNVKTNNYSNEKVVIGILAVSAGKAFYAFSKNKLKLVNNLVPEKNIEKFTKTLLIQVQASVEDFNKNSENPQSSLNLNSLFTQSYFLYLNQYTNGLLQFSEPKEVNFYFDQAKFSQYFLNFVGEQLISEKLQQPKSLHKKLNPFYKKEGLDKKADLNYNLDPHVFKKILQKVQVPLITQNGDISIIQEVDFSNQPTSIKNNIYETTMVTEAIGQIAKKVNKQLKVMIAFEEPELGTEQHDLLDLAFTEYKNIFTFVTPDMVDSFTDQVVHSDEYSKFSPLVEV